MAAETALRATACSAAGGNAVLAGINAADCVAGILTGWRWNGEHTGAAAYVAAAGADGRAVATQLRRLLRVKTEVHYQARSLTVEEAARLVEAARRAVAVARRVAAPARGRASS